MTTLLPADYLVVGAGAAGMAFTDALVDHAGPDVRVVVAERRDGPGGHWRAAYPFVRLHQASMFYGVASTVLGGGVQIDGPERGLHERAGQAEIVAYYDRVAERLTATGRVRLLTSYDVRGRELVPLDGTGERYAVPETCRVVDARYLAPEVPAETPPPFAVADGARVVPVHELPEHAASARSFVVVGSGKTATDAIVWLLTGGTDPGAITWVRPRDPWMLNRAVVQPDPVVYLGMVADMMRSASTASSLDELFLRLEDAGTMHRFDRAVTPTMAKAPTLGTWELELLRSVEHVVRRGHVRAVEPGRLVLADGVEQVAADALVVHCAADGLKNPPRVPVWAPDAITVQPVRAGFPCFGAALIGYVEATRHDDAEKNRLCPPSSFGNTLPQWAAMNVLGLRAAAAFSAEPDIADWASRVALNPARVPPEHPGGPALDDVRALLAEHTGPGVARLAALAGL